MPNENILKKYSDFVLGDRCDSKKFYLQDFLTYEVLRHFLWEVQDGEANFTKLGWEFIEEFYGIENLAKMLFDNDQKFQAFHHESQTYIRGSIEANILFLNNVKPLLVS